MALSKKKVIEIISAVPGVGAKLAEQAYTELGVRSVEDLAAAAAEGKLQSLKGVGPKRAAAISEGLAAAAPAKAEKPKKPAKSPEAKAKGGAKKGPAKTKGKAKDSSKPKAQSKAKGSSKAKVEDAPAAATKSVKDAKGTTPKTQPTPSKAKETPKAKPAESKADKPAEPAQAKPSSASNGARPRSTYRPPTPTKSRPSLPGLLFKLTKKIIGRILG